MSNVGSPEVRAIEEAYEAVRNDKDETTWMIVTAAKGNKLSLTKTGTDKCFVDDRDDTEQEEGGAPKNAIVAARAELDDAEIQYAYVRVEYANDSESTRTKFLLVTWMGPSAGMMRRARVTTEAGEVQSKILRHYSKEIRTDDKKELRHADIVTVLRKAGGADYNGGRG
ncbi:actin depolymerizing protein [Cryphonectria parasitica EP155]|uniref:Actin depolymerizing protein n=1 Tax=Cryphonectria parasitica (strain ATCC 38755 / EP155) TaxID=660469 RepID=A0A9P4XZL4_CRYP1|nr:actin depolymerizing protein [Cryphonectria parasitica EP155]KAF3763933.1 actin depolymerizing protein [Cryphonectria parasitica EP155]